MSYFERVVAVVVVDEAAGDRVTVRKLNYGERQRCLSLATRVNVTGKGQGSVEVDAGLLGLEQLKRAVVSWEGPGFGGMPVAPSYIEALPTEVADLLSKAVDELNPPLSDEEKKD